LRIWHFRSLRVGLHALALSGVLGFSLLGVATANRTVELRAAAVSDPDQPSPELPAQIQLPIGPLPTPLVGPRSTQGADQAAAKVTFNPRLGLPQWLRTLQHAPLWSSSSTDATALGSLDGADKFVKPLGQFVDSRVQVYFPGDADHAAVQAWIDTSNVEPLSGVPGWIAPLVSTGGPIRVGDAPAPDTTAVHIAIIDDASGQLIYGEQPYTEVPQASTTKIATTIVALEREPDLTRRIKVTVSATAMAARDGSSTMGIEPGRSVSLDTLLHGMMLPSGNDAAEQVAVALAGSREQYVDWMNQEAAALGLKDTHFVNPSGMDAVGHYSSAYDMAMLARYAMHNATFRDLAAATRYTGDGYSMANLNRLLDNYPGADGVKIGFTDAAQKTIVASAVRDGHRVYVSLMRSQDLVGDCTALFNWVWKNFSWE
jgi:D-alanyl-D-alanine carboxypeptidase